MKFRLSTPASPPGKTQGTEDNDDEGGSHPAAAGSTDTAPSSGKKNTNKQKKSLKTWRRDADQKVVGLKQYGLDSSTFENRRKLLPNSAHSRRSLRSLTKTNNVGGVKFSVEEKEEEVFEKAIRNPFQLLYLGILAALKVMVYYMSK